MKRFHWFSIILVPLFLLGLPIILAGCGEATSGNTSVDPPVLAAPSNLVATVISANQIDLSWTDNSNGEDGFIIERRFYAGVYVQAGTTSANNTTYSDTEFTAGYTNYYRVRAYNSSGSSGYSNEVMVPGAEPDVSPTVVPSIVPTATPSGLSPLPTPTPRRTGTTPTPTSIPNTPPTASFTVDQLSGDITTNFQFDASDCSDMEDPSLALQVRWDWENDGVWDTGYSTTKTVSHQYTTLGTYTIKLEVKDSGGLTDTITKSVTVVNTAPNATFTVNLTSGDITTVFQFNASGCSDLEDSGTALQVRWDWQNDGVWDTGYSATKTASHQYTTPGTYTVKLQVKDSGGLTNTYTISLTVQKGSGTIIVN